jgi:hypothetical protein
MRDENNIEYDDCFVGNIVGNHYWGEEKIIRSGTKHFTANTKVYCAFVYGGMGHETVIVLGKKRKSFRMIEVSIRTNYIKNLRVQKVYTPRIIDFIKKHQGFFNLCIRQYAQGMIDEVNNNHIEIATNTDI